MARTPKTQPAIDTADASIDQPKVAGAMELMRADVAGAELALTQQNERVAALAKQLNYNGSTDPAVLENSALDAIRRIGMGIFELGAYLLLLREGCERGKFLPVLERLGLEPRAAQRYMEVSRRFSNASTSTHLEAAGMSKLVELLPLADDQIEELTELGHTGELKLDDVATMSVRELRAAVRELKGEMQAAEERIGIKDKAIDKLRREVQRFEKLPPDEKLLALQKDVADAMNDARGAVLGRMRQAVIALVNFGDDRHAHDVFLAGLVGQVQAELAQLRAEFDLPDVSTAAEATLAAEVAQWAGKN